jgi:interferon gamma-inducible protein 30
MQILKIKFILILLQVSLLAISCNKDNQDIPQIDVYVESLCPDCQNFIKDSFSLFLKNPSFSQLAKVNFIPFGNAKENKVGDKYEFTCQHGPNECYGNTVNNCALSKLSYENGLNFMVCFDGAIVKFSKDVKKALEECIENQQLHDDIISCADNMEGNNLMHIAAQKTPEHKYVPWIHFNGKHDIDIENRILSDMNEYLCSLNFKNASSENKSHSFLPGCEEYLMKNFLTSSFSFKQKDDDKKDINQSIISFFIGIYDKIRKFLEF